MKIYEIRKIHEVATRQDADGLITAIKTFQSSAGLNPDGIVGPNTRAKAAELMKNPEQAQLVTTLQTAIKNFQTTAGIGVDGKVGPETMKAVNTAQGLDILSNGFKARANENRFNDDQNTIIYMAFGQSLVGSNNVPCTAR